MTSDLIDRAKHLLGQGRASEATRLLQSALPSDIPAIHTLLGYALYQDNQLAAARRVLQSALQRFPSDATLHEAAARMRWLEGAGDTFAEELIAATEAQPKNLPLRYKCVDLLRLAGQSQIAERLLREILVRAPDDISAKAFLGVLLDETGRLDEAIVLLADTVRAVPNEPMLRLNLAHVLLRLNRADEAMREIASIRRAYPAVQIAISYEAMALKQMGDPKYDWLCDYDRLLKVFDIEPPKGFATVAGFNAAFATRLREFHEAPAHPLEQSLRGGSQTSHNLVHHADPLLRA